MTESSSTTTLAPVVSPLEGEPALGNGATNHDRLQPAFGSNKIGTRHLERKAVVYVRQSNPQQVTKHQESTRLQYDLVQLAERLGWPRDQVSVIDEDQGITAQNLEGRHGFQWLLAEIALDQVGLVLGIEMSRLARSCKDWYQLLEVCALFGTLLADQDGVYDPANYNDRLLLGLKGTMSEAELHIMRGRLNAGRINKAKRGELFSHAPIGYVRSLDTGVHELDPDEQVQQVVRLIFEKFEEIGSGTGVVKYLARNGLKIGVRPHGGPNRGQLEWRRPAISTIINMLHSPTYAGAYSYGRQLTDPRRKKPGRRGSGKVKAPMDQWYNLEQDRLPAYISWDQYQANQKRLAENRVAFPGIGAPRKGPTLLGGLIVCGRCGYRMSIDYSGSASRATYTCKHLYRIYGEGRSSCQRIAASTLDDLVTQQVMQVLEPAALELSVQANRDLERERHRLNKISRQRLERAKYDADRAFRQFNSAEPENRLVARELERRWEESLAEQRNAELDYDRESNQRPTQLTTEEVERVTSLATSIPKLWSAKATNNADRQEIVRCLVERVEVSVQGDTEIVDAKVQWVSGHSSQHQVCRPVARWNQLRDYDELIKRIAELRSEDYKADAVAEVLNKEGFRTPRQRDTFNAECVVSAWKRSHGHFARTEALQLHEWWLNDLAKHLAVNPGRLHAWHRKGWVHSRKSGILNGRWILWADEEELDRLIKLRDKPRNRPFPDEWKIPKPR
jgi:DNA invertase Pin-like site-specific DNA recombinase